MTPSIEMLKTYFNEKHKGHDEVMFWAGVAAYAHLSSPASEKWRREHGFLTSEEDD